jgi:hypothetical protein
MRLWRATLRAVAKSGVVFDLAVNVNDLALHVRVAMASLAVAGCCILGFRGSRRSLLSAASAAASAAAGAWANGRLRLQADMGDPPHPFPLAVGVGALAALHVRVGCRLRCCCHAGALGAALGCVAVPALAAAGRAVRAVRRMRVGDAVYFKSGSAVGRECWFVLASTPCVVFGRPPSAHGRPFVLVSGDAFVRWQIRAYYNAGWADSADAAVSVARAATIAAEVLARHSCYMWTTCYGLDVCTFIIDEQRRCFIGLPRPCYLDALVAQRVRTQHAARRIQRAWRAAITDPRMRLCKQRLACELAEPARPPASKRGRGGGDLSHSEMCLV